MVLILNRSSISSASICMLFTWLLAFCLQVMADDGDKTRWIVYSTDAGTQYLDDNRRPALYTGDFGDCQGNSRISVTRFDASLYKDNMTVMFHMAGTSAINDEHIMMYFSVYAYGENRFNLTFNPCTINVPTLCPVNSSIPVEANGLIPVGPSDLAGIPDIAFSIPDFEGQAIIRLFSNTTETQIACYSAVLTNGSSFSHPGVVGSVLGIFALISLVSSVAVTIYGQSVPETRKHYAHSVSVFVVFSVLQHIFFTGGLSVNWPSVLVAFWSNYAWSAGMIYSKKMQDSINRLIGDDRGNIGMLGSAAADQDYDGLGGGFSLSQIYKRDTSPSPLSTLQRRSTERMLHRRMLANVTSGFRWYGNPVAPGLPLPGNYSGFAGTLAQMEIPSSNAFLTSFLWFLILMVIVAASLLMAKAVVEGLARFQRLKTSRLNHFRSHWLQFTGTIILRACFIAFFMMMYLTLFQFALSGSKGAIAIAAVIFIIFFIGMIGVAAYAIWYRIHQSKFRVNVDKIQVVAKKNGSMTWYGLSRESSEKVNQETQHVVRNFPWWQPHLLDDEGTLHVHDDEKYTTRFGWLSSRFRRGKWWFFSAWLVYEFVRACFYGGAAGHPPTQVFGLLVWEIIALIALVIMRPFESNTLNLLMVYFLGVSKVLTVALSSAFDAKFGVNRVLTTVVGIIIIVIQGALTISLLIAIVFGTFSTYMSITRYHQEFKPKAWSPLRQRYFAHIDQKATDTIPPPPVPEQPKDPYFAVSSVRRQPKIEDEDPDNQIIEEVYEVEDDNRQSQLTLNNPYVSRTSSLRSHPSTLNLPYGARAHRRSWSINNFVDTNAEQALPSAQESNENVDRPQGVPNRSRAASMRDMGRSEGYTGQPADWQSRRQIRTRSISNPQLLRAAASTPVPDPDEIHTIPSREE